MFDGWEAAVEVSMFGTEESVLEGWAATVEVRTIVDVTLLLPLPFHLQPFTCAFLGLGSNGLALESAIASRFSIGLASASAAQVTVKRVKERIFKKLCFDDCYLLRGDMGSIYNKSKHYISGYDLECGRTLIGFRSG